MPKFAMSGKVLAKPDQRDTVLTILPAASREPMPGCEMYIVNTAPSEPGCCVRVRGMADTGGPRCIIKIDSVKALVGKAKPLIAAF